ncbi:hypothetical protein [Actinoplanes sp. N902-109]|uniref:hypothetical protein n=1 Tax=Actinoplanes sp. (strain N902-109) TaxID=649831 RepID=UPI0005A1E3F8|nr:hypothetical protein [Actinoplanes sp. N902-109]
MRLLRLGCAAIGAGLVGALVNLWARHAFPDRWGGPNIGGGMLQLLCFLLIAAGAVLAVAGGVSARRGRHDR